MSNTDEKRSRWIDEIQNALDPEGAKRRAMADLLTVVPPPSDYVPGLGFSSGFGLRLSPTPAPLDPLVFSSLLGLGQPSADRDVAAERDLLRLERDRALRERDKARSVAAELAVEKQIVLAAKAQAEAALASEKERSRRLDRELQTERAKKPPVLSEVDRELKLMLGLVHPDRHPKGLSATETTDLTVRMNALRERLS